MGVVWANRVSTLVGKGLPSGRPQRFRPFLSLPWMGSLFHKPAAAESTRARIQILSDLHLEVGQQYASYTFPASAPLLLLGGDIGRLVDYDAYLKFLEAQSSRFNKVLLVLGNHEFYGMDHDTGLETARRLSEEPILNDKVVLLHRTRWDDPDSPLTVLGCTLWSAIAENAREAIGLAVSDFSRIDGWSIDKHNAAHGEDAAWLREQVQAITSRELGTAERRLLVATHHAPCLQGTSAPAHANSRLTSAFATELLDQRGWDGVRVWAFGHTHYTTEFRRGGTRVVSNQRGYVFTRADKEIEKSKGEKIDAHKFDDSRVIEL
ncbi:putative calcineurin-like phosphoesterase [Xylariales sp. PMI_506]|nr:putative calcineurin-like phosphoesterase [Xylariales sp. PMI_506]